jgi:hypothetical protein
MLKCLNLNGCHNPNRCGDNNKCYFDDGRVRERLRDKIVSDPDVECEAGLSIEVNPMSYSFVIKADTKREAADKVYSELGQVVVGQSAHSADKKAAHDAAEAFIGVLRDPKEGEYVGVSVSGSLSWQEADVFTGASVNVSAFIATKA